MVGLRVRRVPEHHHRIADELVDRPTLGKKRIGQRGKISGRLLHEDVGVGEFGNGRKSLDVGEDDGDFLAAPPSSVEIELSTTRLTISLGTNRANDQMARCARFTVRPSSRISLIWIRPANCRALPASGVWRLEQLSLFRDRDIWLPKIQTAGKKRRPRQSRGTTR